MAPIHPLVAVVVPLSLDIGRRSSYTDQCIETSVATSGSETPAQESSTFPHVWLFGCHSAGTQSNVGVLGLGGHTVPLWKVSLPGVESEKLMQLDGFWCDFI